MPPVDAQVFVDALEVAGVGVYFVDRDRRITYWSRGAEAIAGYDADAVSGNRCADGLLEHVDSRGEPMCGVQCPLTRAMATGERCREDAFMRHRDGHRVPVHIRAMPIRDAGGVVVGAVEVFADASERLAELEKLKRLEADAYVDPLTGIANRRFFGLALNGRAQEADRLGLTFGIAFADVDHFKRVNDAHGHPAGDRVLAGIARTLSSAARSSDVVARWGGEEFAMLVACRSPEELRVALDRRRALVAATVAHVDGVDLRVTASFGGTIARPGEPPDALYARADLALYAAKRGGRDRVEIA
ncbi:MAG: GGDEF domain-containing protein [Myxococcota bacterium]